MRNYDYSAIVKLKHNESPAKYNNETSEITVQSTVNNIPQGKKLQKYDSYNKVNSKALEYLQAVLTNEELGIVFKTIQKCDYETNVMIPLSDSSSYRELAEEFGINKDKVPKIFSKLFKLGVYAHTRVANGFQSEYWTLNPYIAWKGKFIEPSIAVYFDKTIIAKSIR